MGPAHSRDDAKRAGMVASFGDFYVCKVTRRQSKSRRGEIRDESGPDINIDQRLNGWLLFVELRDALLDCCSAGLRSRSSGQLVAPPFHRAGNDFGYVRHLVDPHERVDFRK